MKSIAKLLFLGFIIITTSCYKSGRHEHAHDEMPSNNPNQALYEEVMSIHDDVMPKADDIYQLKKELQEKIKSTDLTTEKKKEFEQAIHELDSADHSMMNWMHKFKYFPEADTINIEANREYLEDELEKIKNVRELILNSIQKAKDEVGKK